MAIDPRDYAKYSGRSGDPHSRLGAALAGAEKQKHKTADAKGRLSGGDMILSHYYYRYIISGIVVLIVGGIAAVRMLLWGR